MNQPTEYTRVCTLQNLVEAEIMEDILSELNIPYYLKTFSSDAYDGLFLISNGWGAVFAPEESHPEILACLEDIRNMNEEDIIVDDE